MIRSLHHHITRSLLLACLLSPVSCLLSQNTGVVYEKASGGLSVDPTLVIDSSGGVAPRTMEISTPSGNTIKWLDLSGAASSPTTISPAQLTSDQDNYNPTGIGKATYVRLSGDSGIRAITGIADSTAGTLEKVIFNVGTTYPICFHFNHPDSDAAHRFLSGKGGVFILYAGKSVKIVYDLTSSGWRIIGDSDDTDASLYYNWSAGSVTAGDNNAFTFLAIGSGTITSTPATTSIPACGLIATVTNASWGGIVYFAKTVSQFAAYGSAHLFAEALISLPAVSDGSQTYTTELQFTPTPTNSALELNNTFGIRYSHGINSGKWQLFTQDNAGAEDIADTGVTVAAATLYRLRIEVDKSKTELIGYINGVYVGRVTGNIPNSVAVAARIIHLKSVGTTTRDCNIHSFTAGAIYPY